METKAIELLVNGDRVHVSLTGNDIREVFDAYSIDMVDQFRVDYTDGSYSFGTRGDLLFLEPGKAYYADQQPNTTAAYINGVRLESAPYDYETESQMIRRHSLTYNFKHRIVFGHGRTALIFDKA